MMQLKCTKVAQIMTGQSVCDTHILGERLKVSDIGEQGQLPFGINYNYS
jgi:hypothetical protein